MLIACHSPREFEKANVLDIFFSHDAFMWTTLVCGLVMVLVVVMLNA